MTKKYYKQFDLNTFWDKDENFLNPIPVTDEMVRYAEELLDYKLPQSYIELLKNKNGGTPLKKCFSTNTPTSWADNHIAIDGIYGIGGNRGIDSNGNRFMIKEWGYPDIGIIICECPSAGHDAVMLDYSDCGKFDEPQIIHVDVETLGEPIRTFRAKDFETFIKGLVSEESLDT